MRATIVCNPVAGNRGASEHMTDIVHVFERAGWEIEVTTTGAAGHATVIARAAVARSDDAVFVAGGDGTINEVIQALAGTETALGYLPFGTVNIWAREIGLNRTAARAAGAMARGRIVSVDLGRANDRYFLLMAGLGFDGEVVRRAGKLERHKARLGILPYAVAGLATGLTYRGTDIELRYDGVIRRVQTLMLIAGNTRLYGGHFLLTPGAVANDGFLDICLLKGRGFRRIVRHAVPILFARRLDRSHSENFRVRELTIDSDQPIPYQLDGELAGATPLRIANVRRALRVIVPETFSSDLIA